MGSELSHDKLHCSAVSLSPDNCSGGIATFRIFSFFVLLLNTVIESASPS